MTNKEFVIELVRLIRPKQFSKITWLLVTTGVVLIAPPLATVFLHLFIKSITKYDLIGEYDILYGFLFILLGLLYNIISQIISGVSSLKFNFIFTRSGNVTINQPTIVIADEKSLQEIIRTLSKSNQTVINYSKSDFTSKFSELYKGLPWVKNVSLEKIENNIEFFRIDYETSNRTIEHFYANIYNETGEQLTLISFPQLDLNSIPNIAIIYWEKWGYWTLNTYQLFDNASLPFEIALKSDFSNIIGDMTYIINDLQIRLTYEKSESNNLSISHSIHGNLQKIELMKNNQYEEIDILDLRIIDSYMDMLESSDETTGNTTLVTETISYPHLFKLSALIIRFLSQSGLPNEFKNSLTVRKLIVEFMKKIEAVKSYAIPSFTTSQIDMLFKQAFDNTWVLKQYEESKKLTSK